MNEFAPILVTVYHRLYALKQCIEALMANPESKASILYVASDAANKIEDVERVNEVREYIKTIRGFRTVIPLIREENLGAHESYVRAMQEVLDKHGSVIFMEDDIVCSKTYLKYMNCALRYYKANKKIFSVCAYKNHFDLPEDYLCNVYYLNRFCPWGFATWVDRWREVKMHRYKREGELKERCPELYEELLEFDPGFVRLMKADDSGALDASDVRIGVHIFITGQLCVYPRSTLTGSIPTGNDSIHCKRRWRDCDPLCDVSITETDMKCAEVAVSRELYLRFMKSDYIPLYERFLYNIRVNGVIDTVQFYSGRFFAWCTGRR